MMADRPIDLTKHREHIERLRKHREEQRHQLERNTGLNQQAYKNFSAYSGKLSNQDRKALASNLYWEVEAYYGSRPDEERYLLLKDAGLTDENSTKVLRRLVLKPSESESADLLNELYASPDKYRWLIEAIARHSSQDEQTLTGCVLYGTSFYPQPPGSILLDASEAHLIYAALREAANRVDLEFHLHEQFKEVARLRSQHEPIYWNHVAATGEFPDIETWHGFDKDLYLPKPDWPDAWPASDRRFNHENGLWWPLDGWRLTDEGFWLDEKPRAPDNAFWVKGDPANPNAARVCDDADFFFVPHAYLGLCIDITPFGYFGDNPPEKLPDLPLPQSIWDESTHSYRLCQPEHVLPDGTVSMDYEFDELTSTTAHWLVMYPDPSTNKLVPMIYAMGEFPGAELIPLSPALIAEFGNTDRWRYFGEDAPTLLQRLKDLTGYRTGGFEIYDSWRETAARFHWNPILRRHPECIDDIRYRKHLSSWLRRDRDEIGGYEED
jgi:hypothetical protein